jgi:hypothetical protein
LIRAVWFLLLSMALGSAYAQSTSPHWPLKQIFKNDAAILALSREAVAEVCPDDNCVRFVIKDPQAIDVVHDFAFLYLWLVESYNLAPRKDAKGERFVVAILNKRKGNCSGADEDAIGRCALAHIAATYQITGIETKFEDGWRRTTGFDLAARLKQAGITP